MSSAVDQGSAIWMPAFHWVEDGSGLSYSYTLSDEGASVASAAQRLQLPEAQRHRSPRRRIQHLRRRRRCRDGRSKYRPPPPRRMNCCRPVEVIGHRRSAAPSRSPAEDTSLMGMPWPAWTRPLVVVAAVRHHGADRERRIRSEQLAGQRVHRLAVGAGAGIDAVRAAGDVEHRRRRRVPLVDEEIRGLAARVVLRRLMHQPHAVVERELSVHLPVVLHVAFDVVVDVFAFDALRALRIGTEAAGGGVRETERRVARVGPDGVLLEVQRRSAGARRPAPAACCCMVCRSRS